MKILYFTDPHLTAKTPIGRLDNFAVAAYKKFTEIRIIVKRENPDLILIGGDLFNTAKISFKYAGMIAEVMRSWGKKILVTPGSHDIYGYNLDTIDQTMLGMYKSTGVIDLVVKGDPFITQYMDQNNVERTLEICGDEHTINVTHDFQTRKSLGTDYQILMAHNMILDKNFHPAVPFILTKDIITEADLVLCGHYHPGWPTHTFGGTTYANPGSLLRLDRNETNKTMMPKMLMIDVSDLSNVKIDEIYLQSASTSEIIFDYSSKAQVAASQLNLSNFKASLQNTSVLQNATTIPDMVLAVAQAINASQSILQTAMNAIQMAQISEDEELPSVNGYLEMNDGSWLEQVIITNFQSHSRSVVDFVKGLNALIGESNQGKTAIMRAILWCLYNDPKGSDFIRTGENEASVELKFNNGKKIFRSRDRVSSGLFRITNVHGITQEFKGFGNNIPVEVLNVHQMPKVFLAKDFEVNVSIASQLDAPFMIGATGANRAAAIGRLIGVQVIDSAIKELSRKAKNAAKDVKTLEVEIKKDTEDLVQFNDIPKIKQVIDIIEFFISQKETIEKKLTQAITYGGYLEDCQKQLLNVTEELDHLSHEDRQIPRIEKAMKDVVLMNWLKERIDQFISVSDNLYRGSMILGWVPKQETYEPLIKEAEELLIGLRQANDLRNARIVIYKEIQKEQAFVDSINYTQINAYLQEAETHITMLRTLVVPAEGLEGVQAQLHVAEQTLAEIDDQVIDCNLSVVHAEKEYKEYLVSIGHCVLCGTKLDNQHIQHMTGLIE